MAAIPPHAGQPVVAAGVPLDEARAVMIMVHGRGASPDSILSLVPHLDRPGVAYLAPAAAGNTWYPYSFIEDMTKNEPALSSALSVLEELLGELSARGVRTSQTMLLGFSQGACLTSEFVARHPARYGGLVALSGGLIGPPGTPRDYEGSLHGTPVFLGCSDVDAHIPKARVEESAAVFERMGARVTSRLYAGMGHEVNEDEIASARALIDQVLAGTG